MQAQVRAPSPSTLFGDRSPRTVNLPEGMDSVSAAQTSLLGTVASNLQEDIPGQRGGTPAVLEARTRQIIDQAILGPTLVQLVQGEPDPSRLISLGCNSMARCGYQSAFFLFLFCFFFLFLAGSGSSEGQGLHGLPLHDQLSTRKFFFSSNTRVQTTSPKFSRREL